MAIVTQNRAAQATLGYGLTALGLYVASFIMWINDITPFITFGIAFILSHLALFALGYLTRGGES